MVHTNARAVGTPAACMTSLANALEPSSCAAAAVGPKQAIPRAVTASATPATSGASGPTTTRPAPSVTASSATSSPDIGSTGCSVATAAMPGLPGAACTWATDGSWDSLRARACSRPPVPITRTVRGDWGGVVTHVRLVPDRDQPSADCMRRDTETE